jgi:hypothetical protein
MNLSDVFQELDELAREVIARLVQLPNGVREGLVMTVGPAPYRRLDCDGRALAYVRTRPKKRMVRVDISGLWLATRPSRLRARSSNGAATLIVKTRRDMLEAVHYLEEVVSRTRAAEARAFNERSPESISRRRPAPLFRSAPALSYQPAAMAAEPERPRPPTLDDGEDPIADSEISDSEIELVEVEDGGDGGSSPAFPAGASEDTPPFDPIPTEPMA